ncbi:MAG TPA: hypothetical protein VFW89_08415 [Gemmatimonadaceae bacterium]|nr:hypothetical protein [Gemmatimonadaceae bacterium]
MTIAEWLDAHDALAPPALRARVREALGFALEQDAAAVPDAALAATEELLTRWLAADERARAGALELLAADALVTYAFEAAADAPDLLPARARCAMARIAALAPVPASP